MSQGRLGNVFVVASSTFGSRILGLARDATLFAFLGLSSLNSAFLLAFTLPNLFRRMLGEGALTSAFVPIFSKIDERDGREAAFCFLNQAMSWLALVLILLSAIGVGLLMLVPDLQGLEERWYVGAELAVVLFPYLLLVCLCAFISAALNVIGHFAAAALSQVWLNLSMIVSLVLFAHFFAQTPLEQVHFLCAGVLVGGLLQVVIPAVQLVRVGWRPKFDFAFSEELRDLIGLFIPGLAGAAVFQVNIVVVRLLAFSLSAGAMSVLYLANRLVELPLGVFAIAITTVFFPELARSIAKNDREAMAEAHAHGKRLILAVTVPASVGLLVLAKPILILLFEWGQFTAQDVGETTPVLMLFALGIPFYALGSLSTRALHATRAMTTSLKLACLYVLTNGLLSFWWMQFWGIYGLALGSLAAGALHCVLLEYALKRKEGGQLISIRKAVGKIAMAALFMGLMVGSVDQLIAANIEDTKLSSFVSVGVCLPLGVAVYMACLLRLRLQEARDLLAMLPFFKARMAR